VINTSLNLHGEPIVCTLQEAATTSAAAGASLLWVG
jgi:predicted NodU family carbamoyl transferase